MDVMSWIAPDGTVLPLDDPRYFILQDIDGRGLPPVQNITDVVPAIDGERLRQVNVTVRDIAIPMMFTADSRDELRTLLKSIVPLFYTRNQDGTLVIKYSDGSSRRINCRYSNGLTLEASGNMAARTFQQVMLILTAFDPFWYGDTIARSWPLGASTQFFSAPFFPLRLSPSSLQGSAIVNNPGDDASYPVWTVVGPGTSLDIRNLDTGEHITLAHTLVSGEVITIDTRVGSKSIVSSVSGNLYGSMSLDSNLWALPTGDSSLTFGMNDATSVASVSMVFNPRYLSA